MTCIPTHKKLYFCSLIYRTYNVVLFVFKSVLLFLATTSGTQTMDLWEYLKFDMNKAVGPPLHCTTQQKIYYNIPQFCVNSLVTSIFN